MENINKSSSENVSKDKIFIPFSIEDIEYKRNNYFLSDIKMMYIALYIILSAFLVIMFLPIIKSRSLLLIGLSVYLYITQLYFRKIIFEEDRWIDIYKKHKSNKETNLSSVWGIYDIEDGVIKYINLYNSVIIKLNVGLNIGYSDEDIRQCQLGLERFYNKLLESKYSFYILNVHERVNNVGIQEYDYIVNNEANQINDNLRETCRMCINYIKRLMSGYNISSLYIMVLSSKGLLANDLSKIKMFLDELIASSYFSGYEILKSKKDILDLILKIHNLRFANLDELTSSVRNASYDLKEEPFTVLKKYDQDGLEIVEAI